MPRQDSVKALMAAINTGAYGTDPVPATPMRAYNFELSLNGNVIEDDPVQPYMGAGDDHVVGRHVGLSFDIRAVGAGVPGTVPPYGALLRMCGLSETITADTDVTYAPVSSGFEDGGVYFLKDGKRRALLGVRGTATLTVQKEDIPFIRFELTGLYTAPSEDTMPAVDWSTWQAPLPAEPTNTPVFTLHGYGPTLLSLSAQLGQSVQFVSRVNDERIDISDRKGSASLVIDEPDTLAEHDYEAAMIAGTTGPLALVHGTTAGNVIEFGAPKARIRELSEGEESGRVTQEMTLTLRPDAGNDEWKLIVR